MKAKLLSVLIAMWLPVVGFGALTTTNLVYAEESQAKTICDGNAPDEIKAAAGCGNASASPNELSGAIKTILEAVIAICGLIAVVFVLIGGINYMTSAGDAQKVEKAKKTILYACIGIAICALAFVIVDWAIGAIMGTNK